MSTGTTGDYEVGSGTPPRGAGFKKGQSGTPRGRPRGLLALLEAGTPRRLAVTHLVIALRPGRHFALSCHRGLDIAKIGTIVNIELLL